MILTELPTKKISEAPKLLDLPLTEDQYLRKTVNLSLAYYKARLQSVN